MFASTAQQHLSLYLTTGHIVSKIYLNLIGRLSQGILYTESNI